MAAVCRDAGALKGEALKILSGLVWESGLELKVSRQVRVCGLWCHSPETKSCPAI